MGFQLPPPPAGIDLTRDRSASIIAGTWITWTFALVMVAIRFAGRRMKRRKLWLDDWLILAAIVHNSLFYKEDDANLSLDNGSWPCCCHRRIWSASLVVIY